MRGMDCTSGTHLVAAAWSACTFDVSQRFHEAITSIGGMWGGHSGAVWMLGSYAIPLHNSNFDFACMSKEIITKNQNENNFKFI